MGDDVLSQAEVENLLTAMDSATGGSAAEAVVDRERSAGASIKPR